MNNEVEREFECDLCGYPARCDCHCGGFIENYSDSREVLCICCSLHDDAPDCCKESKA